MSADTATTSAAARPADMSLGDWLTSRIARYDTRTYDWDAL